jgi:hypothetical protein
MIKGIAAAIQGKSFTQTLRLYLCNILIIITAALIAHKLTGIDISIAVTPYLVLLLILSQYMLVTIRENSWDLSIIGLVLVDILKFFGASVFIAGMAAIALLFSIIINVIPLDIYLGKEREEPFRKQAP